MAWRNLPRVLPVVAVMVPRRLSLHSLKSISKSRTSCRALSVWYYLQLTVNDDRRISSLLTARPRRLSRGATVSVLSSFFSATNVSSFHASLSSSQQVKDDKDIGVAGAGDSAAPDSLDGPAESESSQPNSVASASNSEDNDTIEIVVTLPNQSDNGRNDDSADKVFDIPGAVKGGRKLALIYTCAVCETRAIKQFTERAYRHGVVIVTCPTCRRQHLIADHLGYFDSDRPFDLESLVLQQGHSFQTVKTQDDMAQVSLQDIVGKAKMDELLRDAKKEK